MPPVCEIDYKPFFAITNGLHFKWLVMTGWEEPWTTSKRRITVLFELRRTWSGREV